MLRDVGKSITICFTIYELLLFEEHVIFDTIILVYNHSIFIFCTLKTNISRVSFKAAR
jgi:hypothetical protein